MLIAVRLPAWAYDFFSENAIIKFKEKSLNRENHNNSHERKS